ncbi:hypothetical protein SCATT_p00560 (plasmid) [Streptantibioticus cattleyicolor NRRL 8057 = DSM 46488]|uniref:Uncharacterized protein n=1 Tax=Streptantibioticus cattleyicolor (strain ATCC 35852 / DSM 46488 / JCM 4925 / NBRC 14057 / NRRL 8057) TaxID=1003195 RepID=G8XDQ4_STREN|nr:hypothetical protein SCATT_p00560 [Streptantibioticus cattleyicolor NRRL 8057 = DSM 46488]
MPSPSTAAAAARAVRLTVLLLGRRDRRPAGSASSLLPGADCRQSVAHHV